MHEDGTYRVDLLVGLEIEEGVGHGSPDAGRLVRLAGVGDDRVSEGWLSRRRHVSVWDDHEVVVHCGLLLAPIIPYSLHRSTASQPETLAAPPLPLVGLNLIAGVLLEGGRMQRPLIPVEGWQNSFGAYIAANTFFGPVYFGYADSTRAGSGRFYLFIGTP